MVVPGGGDTSFAVASEQHFHLPQFFIFRENLRAALLEFARDLRRTAFHGKIQIAQRSPGDEVTHGSARQVHIAPERCGQFLYAHHRRALFGREPAFQQKHVVWHCAPSSSGVRADRRGGTRNGIPGTAALCTRMMRLINLFQPFLDNVRVNLRRGDVRVAEHELHRPEVRSPLEQVGGKTVPQHVRRQGHA